MIAQIIFIAFPFMKKMEMFSVGGTGLSSYLKSNVVQTTKQEDVMFKLAVIKLPHKAHLKRQICHAILLQFRSSCCNFCNLQEMIAFYHIVYVCILPYG